MNESFEIRVGSRVVTSWTSERQENVGMEDPIVFDPGREDEDILVGQLGVFSSMDVKIICEFATIPPHEVLGVIGEKPYTLEELFEFTSGGQDVPIENPVRGTDNASAVTRVTDAVEEDTTRWIGK